MHNLTVDLTWFTLYVHIFFDLCLVSCLVSCLICASSKGDRYTLSCWRKFARITCASFFYLCLVSCLIFVPRFLPHFRAQKVTVCTFVRAQNRANNMCIVFLFVPRFLPRFLPRFSWRIVFGQKMHVYSTRTPARTNQRLTAPDKLVPW